MGGRRGREQGRRRKKKKTDKQMDAVKEKEEEKAKAKSADAEEHEGSMDDEGNAAKGGPGMRRERGEAVGARGKEEEQEKEERRRRQRPGGNEAGGAGKKRQQGPLSASSGRFVSCVHFPLGGADAGSRAPTCLPRHPGTLAPRASPLTPIAIKTHREMAALSNRRSKWPFAFLVRGPRREP